MSAPYTLDVGVELAVLDTLEKLAARYDDPWHIVFDGGPATVRRGEIRPMTVHPAAMIGSAVDDVMVEMMQDGTL